MVEARALDCRSGGPGFETTYCRFETWAISFIPLCMSFGRGIEVVGPFYLTGYGEKNLSWTSQIW